MSEYGGVFRTEPQPTQGRRFVPIPAQGDQPPPRQNFAATIALLAAASWPSGLEYQAPVRRPVTVPIPAQGDQPPRYTTAPITSAANSWPSGLEFQPYQRTRYAPIPAQGDQPPPVSEAAEVQQYVTSWPTGQEYQPYQQTRYAPIPAQGQQPPPIMGELADMAVCIQSWVPPDPMPVQKPLNIAPLTLTYGNQPPRISGVNQATIVAAWVPPDPQPVQHQPTVPIPAQGDQPPRIKRATPYPPEPDPMPVQRGPIAGVIPPPVVSQAPFVPLLQQSVLLAWTPPDPQPARRVPTVPIPAQGSQPSPISGVNTSTLIQASWQALPDRVPQQRAITAPIPAQGDQPPRYSVGPLARLVASWNPPDPQPVQRLLDVAPLTLAYGDQPPRISGVNQSTISASWTPPDPLPVQHGPITAAIPPVPVVAFTPIPSSIAIAWLPPDPQPARRVPTVPIPTQGNNPPQRPPSTTSGNLWIAIRAWEKIVEPNPHQLPPSPIGPITPGFDIIATVFTAVRGQAVFGTNRPESVFSARRGTSVFTAYREGLEGALGEDE